MYQSQKDTGPARIRLPKSDHAPDKTGLNQALTAALERLGAEVEVSWSEPGIGKSRSLIVKMDQGQGVPYWLLWESDGKETKLIWNYVTADIDLLNDLLLMLDRNNSASSATAPSSQPGIAAQGAFLQPTSHPSIKSQPTQAPLMSTAESAHNLYLDLQRQSASIRTSLSGMQRLGSNQQDVPGGSRHESTNHQAIRVTGSHPVRTTGSHENPSGALAPPNSFAAANRAGEAAHASQPESKPAHFIDPQTFINSAAGQAASAVMKAANSLKGQLIVGLAASSPTTFEGSLDFVQTATLLRSIGIAQLTGKLELVAEESVGTIYFVAGEAQHAATTANSGDNAIAEMVAWEKGSYSFRIDERTAIRSIISDVSASIADGIALLDKKKHLHSAGLTHESYLIKKHKQVADSELKVFLMKGSDVDVDIQIAIYRKIGARCTLADLLRDRPMETALWTRVLFNFLTCGLIEIKPPDSNVRGLLDFLCESKAAVQAIENVCLRPETGIYTYAALLYFLQYEFYRYEAYGWPVTLVIMDINKRSQELERGLDLVNQQETAIALKRMELLKRPLDIIGHFETLHYALLLPNTRASAGAYLANRAMQAIIAAPLSSGLDKRNLHLAFGIASIPADANDVESLLIAAKRALSKASEGDFPIVVAH